MYTGRVEEERASSSHLRPDSVLSGMTEAREREAEEEDARELKVGRVGEEEEEGPEVDEAEAEREEFAEVNSMDAAVGRGPEDEGM